MSACPKCQHDPAAVVAASWSFHVDRDPPSLNSRLFNVGTKRWAYKRERDTWCMEFRTARILKRIAKASGKRRVTLTRNYAGRQQLRDVDNLSGGMKAVVDALVLEGLLVDDNAVSAEIHYAQARTTPVGLVVLIEELAS